MARILRELAVETMSFIRSVEDEVLSNTISLLCSSYSSAFLLNSLYANDRTTIKTGRRLRGRRGDGTSIMAWRLFQRLPAGYIIESSFTPQFTMNLSLFPTAGLRHPPLLGIRLWPLAKYGYNDFVIIEKGAAAKDTSNLTRDKNLDPLP